MSIADQLSRAGRTTLVVDHQSTRNQTSWAAAGILPPANFEQAHDDYNRLCGLSLQMHHEMAARYARGGHDVEFRACGGLHLARTAGEAAALAAVTQQWTDDGVEVERIEPGDLADRFPAVSNAVASSEIRFACWAPGEAQVRTPRYLTALRNACETQGVEIWSDCAVSGISTSGDAVTSIETPRGEVRGEQYCIAAGAWSESLLRLVDWTIDTEPWRGQVVLLKRNQPEFDYVINEGPNYLVPRDDGHVVVGSSVEEVGFDDATTEEVFRDLNEYATELVPCLADATCERHWSGLRPGSPDGFPYLGVLPHLGNLYVAAGHYRSGIYLSPASGLVMKQLMCGERPDVSLDSFRLDR